MNIFFKSMLQSIEEEEQKISMDCKTAVEDSRVMIILLTGYLKDLKEHIRKKGFGHLSDEIEFFKVIKPTVYGKLLFYNKVFRIEVASPVAIGDAVRRYFTRRINKLEEHYAGQMSTSEFYRYYRSGNTYRDTEYFVRGNIHITEGLKPYAFEIDYDFSTYYDHEAAKIIESDLLYEYLHDRINTPDQVPDELIRNMGGKPLSWTAPKNALIELIYALHASQSIAYGKIEIRKIITAFQWLFNVQLGDAHHSFHRMKFRSGERCIYLSDLIESLESYMDKDLK